MTTEYGQEVEQMIQDSNPTGPRVSLEDFNANITDVEVFKVITKTGKIMRWAVLTTKSGFAVTGNPSVAVSEENDRPNIGELNPTLKTILDILKGISSVRGR